MPSKKTTSKKSSTKSAPKSASKKAATKKAASKKATTKKASTKKTAAKAADVVAEEQTEAKRSAARIAEKIHKSGEMKERKDDSKRADEDAAEMNERVQNLIRKSKEQGYLTYADINSELPNTVESSAEIENVITILENLDIDIIDNEEVELYKQRLEEHNEEE